MSEQTAPADNADYDSGEFRALNRVHGNGILDDKTNLSLSYPLTLPGSGNDATVGAGSSRVEGFLHQVVGSATVTIPAPTAGTTVYTVVVRYDPTRSATNPNPALGPLGVPCALAVVAGTAGGGAPALTQSPAGVWDMPLYDVTRAVGQALSAATKTDRRVWVSGTSASSNADVGNGGTPSVAVQPKPGRRTVTADNLGRAAVVFDTPFPTICHSITGITVVSSSGGAGTEVPGTISRTGFTALLRGATGAPLANQAVTFNYLAWGY